MNAAPAPLGDRDRRAIAANLSLHEYVRRARPGARRTRGHREWLHFFVANRGLELFVNLSVFDDMRPAARADERGRVLVLARSGGHGGHRAAIALAVASEPSIGGPTSGIT